MYSRYRARSPSAPSQAAKAICALLAPEPPWRRSYPQDVVLVVALDLKLGEGDGNGHGAQEHPGYHQAPVGLEPLGAMVLHVASGDHPQGNEHAPSDGHEDPVHHMLGLEVLPHGNSAAPFGEAHAANLPLLVGEVVTRPPVAKGRAEAVDEVGGGVADGYGPGARGGHGARELEGYEPPLSLNAPIGEFNQPLDLIHRSVPIKLEGRQRGALRSHAANNCLGIIHH
mmetsp:Transcript_39300/g.125343  ORF Transcript_39300/g.125343 Transcript_39300/m.125343 type:complete len:227 (+) Transcript_39300:390-1070(+)